MIGKCFGQIIFEPHGLVSVLIVAKWIVARDDGYFSGL